jgi:hypothetical protein
MHFPKGEKLTGWVAATHRTVCNSDPSLDFIDSVRRQPGCRVRACRCSPTSLVGVFALCACRSFNDQHRDGRTQRPLAHDPRVLDLSGCRRSRHRCAGRAAGRRRRRRTEVATSRRGRGSRSWRPMAQLCPTVVARAAALRRPPRRRFPVSMVPRACSRLHVDRRGATTLAHARVASSPASQSGDVGMCGRHRRGHIARRWRGSDLVMQAVPAATRRMPRLHACGSRTCST